MGYGKRARIIIFSALVLFIIINSFYITPLEIIDTDPSTYAIVPILMLPLLALFLMKKEIVPNVAEGDILFGMVLFTLFIMLTVYLRFSLSYLFVSYKVYMLILPALLSSLAILLFGSKNLVKFRMILAYALLASPILLMPIINLNKTFTVFNTLVIYSGLRLFVHNATYIPPITIVANGYRVGIGETCVGIGVLIAIVLFLMPLAFFYNGGNRRKVLWTLSGFLLLLLLNILRMFGIAAVWILYGISSALSTVHLFAGIALFYLSIIIMMLASGKYGLWIDFGGNKKTLKTRHTKVDYGLYGIATAIIISALYYLLTLNYANLLYVSPISIVNNNKASFNSIAIANFVVNATNTKGFTSLIETDKGGNSTTILMYNSTINASAPIVLFISPPKASVEGELLGNSTLKGRLAFLGNDGIRAGVYDVVSNNTEFIVYHTVLPYQMPNGTTVPISAYGILPASEVGMASCSNYNVFYTRIYNILALNLYNRNATRRISSAYCIFNKLVRA